ncbi:hypothetical protein ALC62_14219 [Cyphomyrmex costatus]|uniref:Uncharacterized protein n=1 Tax=Cyphomyrmex costatus TaxID=456900 RepID=A0A151I9I9_9HYME|nr:hypothetical protein ALC62_14219 [Cyphomyrmex costatus]
MAQNHQKQVYLLYVFVNLLQDCWLLFSKYCRQICAEHVFPNNQDVFLYSIHCHYFGKEDHYSEICLIIYLFVQRVSCLGAYPYILSNGSARYFVLSATQCDHFARDDEPLSVLTFLCSLGLRQPSGQARKSDTL